MFVAVSVWSLGVLAVDPARALQDVVDSQTTQSIVMYKGDVVTLKVYSLTRLAVTQPGIIELAQVTGDQVLLVGQREGETPLFMWDEYGKKKIMVKVIMQDLDQVADRINNLLLAAEIKNLKLRKNVEENKVVITGKVPRDRAESYAKILDPFVMDVIDLTTETGQLIQVDVQITELTTTLAKSMGVLWSTGSETLDFPFQETLPDFNDNIFKIGDFERTEAIQATVNMLLAEGKARVLSKPSIIVTSGEAATFLVGGEIPIRTTTVSEGNVTEDIDYKSYGVDLTVTPELLADKINLDMNVSIRDVDASNAVGDTTAFTTRSANTRLLLDDGQTIILAGLIKSNKGEQVTRVPFLSDIPILGALFRSKSWSPNREEEVVISLTTKILDDKIKAQEVETGRQAVNKNAQYLLIDEAEEMGRDIYGAGEEYMTDEELLAMMERQPRGGPRDMPGRLQQNVRPSYGDDLHPGGRLSNTITAYAQDVQKRISRAITFPPQARDRGWEGVVTLSLDILSDGSLVDVAVEESSGYSILDTDAVNTAQLTSPYNPFPGNVDLEEIRLTLPIIYSQEDVIEDIIWR